MVDPSPDENPLAVVAGLPPVSSVVIAAPPDQVFAILMDPSTYPDWLVGARRIREVDPDWPAVGSRFHHRIGFGPLQVPGSTSVRRCDRPQELALGAGMGPLGEASVRFRLTATPGGTRVEVTEEPSRGAVRLAWRRCRRTVGAVLWGRNAVSLAALDRAVTGVP